VAGSVAQRAGYAGHAWAFLQYLLGLQELGHEVLFVDVLPSSGEPAQDRARATYLTHQLRALGERVPVAVLGSDAPGLVPADEALSFTRTASALINVMGFLRDERFLDAGPLRVFLDIDPGFGQMWRELGLADVLAGHDAHVTVGGNVGKPGCEVPTCGLQWITTRPPVVLRHWPAAPVEPADGGMFTTVASWRGPFGPVTYQGRTYGLRVHEFRRFLGLPSRSGADFELALDIDDAEQRDLELLRAHGWRLRAPASIAGDVVSYRTYVQRSAAELLVAKHMYVDTRSGWFSDRSACYLASGRPVLAQDTGLSGLGAAQRGLVLFSDLDEAVAGVRDIRAGRVRHAVAARVAAERLFASSVVLPELLSRLALTSQSRTARTGRRIARRGGAA